MRRPMKRRTPKPVGPTGALGTILEVWEQLFSTPIHLDSAISKIEAPTQKSVAARILPVVLRRPVTLARQLGVETRSPWQGEVATWNGIEPLLEDALPQIEKIEKKTGAEEDFPEHFLQEMQQDWGDQTHQLAEELTRDPPMGLRAGRSQGASKMLEALKAEVDFAHGGPARSTVSPVGISVAGYAAVAGSTPFKEGWGEIQDEGSQFMALFALWPEIYGSFLQDAPGAYSKELPPEPPRGRSLAWNVVDACAGAGGKSLAMADFLEGRGRVFAYDVSSTKLQALKRRAQRWNLNNIQTRAVTSGSEEEVIRQFAKTADRVLVDAPCSGWGVLRRNPDIKWRQMPQDISDLPELQLRLLATYSQLVKPQGILTYGLCTFRKEETLEVTERFLQGSDDFELISQGYLGPGPCDGFFMASFRRKK